MNKFGRFGNNLSVLPQEYFSKRRSAAENTFENAAKKFPKAAKGCFGENQGPAWWEFMNRNISRTGYKTGICMGIKHLFRLSCQDKAACDCPKVQFPFNYIYSKGFPIRNPTPTGCFHPGQQQKARFARFLLLRSWSDESFLRRCTESGNIVYQLRSQIPR